MSSKIVRIFTNYEVVNESQMLGRDPDDLRLQGIEVIFNRSGKADLVVVLNTVSKPRWVFVPKGKLLKVLQEPIIRNPLTHLFTYHHSSIFDLVLTHTPDQNDPRQIRSIPYLGSFVDPTQFELQIFNQKTNLISIISSTLAVLPGHKIRSIFIQNLLIRFPTLEEHTYGRGRKQELVSKIDGLEKYRYSIAIENSVSPSYITEKFFDCIIAGCVPLYYGAPNIGDYFSKDCYVPLPINDDELCSQIIMGLSESDYEKRIPALTEARSLIRDRYSLSSLVNSHLEAKEKVPFPKRRFVFLLTADSLIYIFQQFISRVIPKSILLRVRKLN